jgi:pyridoxal phosphate enzyme (YggS family)
MTDIASNIKYLKQNLPESVKLVAVSKTIPVSKILEAYDSGQRYFGENRVQELLAKKDLLPSDIEWHLIGHLQSNKVKYVVPFISMIQSVDTFKLLNTIDFEGSKIERVINCLLQIHIAKEETKFGFSMDEINNYAISTGFTSMKNVQLCGVMSMASFTEDTEQIGREFRYLRECYNILKDKYFRDSPNFKCISMGMSGDYKIAVEEGSTLVRIGSFIFGDRQKKQ